MKSSSLPSVFFVLEYFSIKPVQNLGEFHKYVYSKMEKLHKYGYFANLVVNEAYNVDKILSMFCDNNNSQVGFYFTKDKLLKNTKTS